MENSLLSQSGLFDEGYQESIGGAEGAGNITNPFLKGSALEGLTGQEFVQKLVPAAIGLIFVAGFIFFIFMFLWGAVSWIISGGDKGTVESARGKITNSIVGLVLLLSSLALVKVIEAFFGIDILSIDIGPLVIQ